MTSRPLGSSAEKTAPAQRDFSDLSVPTGHFTLASVHNSFDSFQFLFFRLLFVFGVSVTTLSPSAMV